MSSSLLEAAFAHHVWATCALIDACRDLPAEQLDTYAAGTRGTILETVRHSVENDAFDLFVLTGDRAFNVDAGRMSLSEARGGHGARRATDGPRLVSGPLDPDAVVQEVDEGRRVPAVGTRRIPARGNPGTRHGPSQPRCSALTTIGVEPPKIAVFDFGVDAGRIVEQMPGTSAPPGRRLRSGASTASRARST